MSRLVVAPIVEGHGEVASVRTLLQRVWFDVLGGEYIDVLRPIRASRNKIVQANELGRIVELAALKLQHSGTSDPGAILVMIDADEDCPADLGPQLVANAKGRCAGFDVFSVVVCVEYETWFVAAANSLADYLDLSSEPPPADPEAARTGKAWINRHFKGKHYSPTIDQPAMTASMDLQLCRSHSASFEKLCRELSKRCSTTRG